MSKIMLKQIASYKFSHLNYWFWAEPNLKIAGL